MSSDSNAYAAGWYPDEHQPGMVRWYDGSAWTEHRQPASSTAGPVRQAGIGEALGAQPARTSWLAIASLGFAVIGLGLIGIILGVAALVSIGKANPPGSIKGRGLAIAGIVTSLLWGLIVLAVFLAIAVPTVVGQASYEESRVARTNAKILVNEVEACAASNADGSYTGCASLDEPFVQPILLRGCTAPGGGCVKLTRDNMGYTVVAVGVSNPPATFTETHAPDGAIEKTCAPAGEGGCPDSGTW